MDFFVCFAADGEDVDDIKYCNCVEYEEYHKPTTVIIACCKPQRPSFPRQCPQHNKDENKHLLITQYRSHARDCSIRILALP